MAEQAVSIWTDYRGRQWPVVQSTRRLKFKYPAHAALRAHVFHVHGYRCQRCPAVAIDVPENYDGRHALSTNTAVVSRWRDSHGRRVDMAYSDVLILDHKLTLPAGGLNHVDNFQPLCETCNKSKQREDKAATAAYMRLLA